MKTTLHYYYLNTETQANEYDTLCNKLKAQGLKKFGSITANHNTWYSEHIKPLNGKQVELETECLFDNQWNTAPTDTSENGLRIFDWAEAIYENPSVKEGHWLEQTKEMKEIRRNTNVCGYCGNYKPAAKGDVFCSKCLGSSYLQESELHLTRMMPVNKGLWGGKRQKLTEAEKAHLLPLYVAAQTKGIKAQAEKVREDIRKTYKRRIETAATEWRGFTWLLDHEILTNNCIYYSHTNKFCFGWRSPLDENVARQLESDLRGFPFVYEMKENGNQ